MRYIQAYWKIIEWFLGDKCIINKRLYLNYVTLKFQSTYRFLWGHELANSFRLLRLHSSFFTDDSKFFVQTKITFFANVAVGVTFL